MFNYVTISMHNKYVVHIKESKKLIDMLPPFNKMGNLPPGIYEITWELFIERFGFNSHRQRILSGLQTVLVL